MTAKLLISKLGSGLLLVLLLVSITPRVFIHEAFADHKDDYTHCGHKTHQSACIKQADMDCHFTELVVSLPYLFFESPGLSPLSYQFTETSLLKKGLAPEIYHPVTDSRGPPALV